MSFDDPSCIVYCVFALHARHLEDHVDVGCVVGTCLYTGEQLTVFSHESVTTARERTEGDLVRAVLFAVKELELAFEHPLGAFPKFGILRLK